MQNIAVLARISEFVKEMESKGYDGYFQTAGGFNNKLGDSIAAYIDATLMGKENGFKDGLSLFTYLEYNGEGKDYVTASMNVDFTGGEISVNSMAIQRYGIYGQVEKCIRLEQVSLKKMPAKSDAVKLAYSARRIRKNVLRF